MKRISAILAVLLCMLLLLGCSGNAGPSNSKSTETVDSQTQAAEEESAETAAAQESEEVQQNTSALIEPEQLISQEEAEALLGEPLVGEKKEESVVGLKIIFYKAADENSNQYLQISLTQQAFMPDGSTITPESQYQAICGAFEAEPVSGLGDEAQIIPSGYQIMCDGYFLEVAAGFTSDDNGIMSEASQTAVKNLKALHGK